MNNKLIKMVERSSFNWGDIADVITIGAVTYIGLRVFTGDEVAQYFLERGNWIFLIILKTKPDFV